jgi:hypothetical protein
MKDNGNTTTIRTTTAVSDQRGSDMAVSSVDDHFTKALGAETWRQIKANSEKTVHMQTVHRYPT